eukprot:13238585-Heterocapsa_arctica.AAC.1
MNLSLGKGTHCRSIGSPTLSCRLDDRDFISDRDCQILYCSNNFDRVFNPLTFVETSLRACSESDT